jgi:hypothetical protein
MRSGDLHDNACHPTEITPKVVDPFSTSIDSNSFKNLPGLCLQLSLVQLESCKYLLRRFVGQVISPWSSRVTFHNIEKPTLTTDRHNLHRAPEIQVRALPNLLLHLTTTIKRTPCLFSKNAVFV